MADYFLRLNLYSFKTAHNEHFIHLLLEEILSLRLFLSCSCTQLCKRRKLPFNFQCQSLVRVSKSQVASHLSNMLVTWSVVWYKCWPAAVSQHYSCFKIHATIKSLARFLQNWILTIVQVLIICTVPKQLLIGTHRICSCYSSYCFRICSLCDGKDPQAYNDLSYMSIVVHYLNYLLDAWVLRLLIEDGCSIIYARDSMYQFHIATVLKYLPSYSEKSDLWPSN